MPSRRTHLSFDNYLVEHEVIPDTDSADTVHDRIDAGLTKYGPDHRFIDFYHSEEGLRSWLRSMTGIAYQETLTKYLRIGLGHLALDDISSRNPEMDEDELIKSAYRSFSQKGFGRSYFKR